MPGRKHSFDELLSALADGTRRGVVRYFERSGDDVATVEDLAAALPSDGSGGTARRLHHVALPKLARAGIVEYDPATRAARYRGDELREPVRELLVEVRAAVSA
ncbi:DUF7344 domain-containing protein [Halobaculum litoreum]|uniref:DUF7344 domain-containing protein n=1 Tax=Halobaculum litoreum TaxID=3031998 RepID=UPI0024C2E67F|nr:hypothetical protein [Halobaculum sp. DT92]